MPQKWLPFRNPRADSFGGGSFSGAGVLTPDKQGRVLIPQDLRQFAGLEKDVVVIGANTKAEIWDRARWEALNAAWDPREMLQTLEEIGF